jgi:hypothetical protein
MNNKKYYVLFLISLLSVWAELALSGCFRATDQSAQRERDSIAKLLEAYIDGYKSGDYGKVRFAADVTLEGPLTSGKILGKPAVQKFSLESARKRRACEATDNRWSIRLRSS